jgi:predicted RNA-binding protein
MCQSNAYLERDGQQRLIIEDVGLIRPEGDKILLISIFGEEELVDANIKMIDLLHHKIVLEKTQTPYSARRSQEVDRDISM